MTDVALSVLSGDWWKVGAFVLLIIVPLYRWLSARDEHETNRFRAGR